MRNGAIDMKMNLRQRLSASAFIPRHRHAGAYAAVVLQGGYQEAGDRGRWRAQAGDVLIHPSFTSHLDLVSAQRAMVLNLPLPMVTAPAGTHYRVHNPDLLVRIAERDPVEAAAMLLDTLQPGGASAEEPVDAFAAALRGQDAPSISAWSDAANVRRETLFRWFQAAYGVSPTQYRIEARAWHAWHAIVDSPQSLGMIAAETGFADQAHMSRAVRVLTGHPPRHWRMQHSFKTRTR